MVNQNSASLFYEAAIIGAGFAGIGAGIKLKEKGYNNFIIFERGSEVGGTWRDNTYPGCGCDIPSLLYSYSFEPNPNWSRSFSRQPEIFQYIKDCVTKYKLEDLIQYNTAIERLEFEEKQGIWKITDKKGHNYSARMIISASGPLNEPNYPSVDGRVTFEGRSFHSMWWDHDCDLKGKKIAVIGTGASAIQFIPEIADESKKLYVFQRTAPWIAPRNDMKFSKKVQEKFRKHLWYQRFWREIIYWILEDKGRSQYSKNNKRKKRTKECLNFLEASISDPVLRKKLTPDYELGCKRILITDNYLPTLEKENVELVTDPIDKIIPKGILCKDGKKYEVDVIIYGTGFHATQFNHKYDVIGRGGRSMFEEFQVSGGEAYYGITVNGYPNFLIMVGPNTGLGHNSIIHMMESQLSYIMDYIKALKSVPSKKAFLDVKQDVQEEFNDKIQAKLSKMVWSEGGCKSYYLHHMDGKNTTIWPGTTIAYRRQTKKIRKSDYELVIPEADPIQKTKEELINQ